MKQIITALTALGLAVPANAQVNVPPPVRILDLAQRAAAAAIKACKGTPIAVAVVDYNGDPRLLIVADTLSGRMGNFAIRKAVTAWRFKKPSAQTRDEATSNPELAAQSKGDPTLIGFGGGLPVDGGAVGVAGAPIKATDERCAEAAKAVMGQ